MGLPKPLWSFFPKAGEGSFHAVVALICRSGYVDITHLESHVVKV